MRISTYLSVLALVAVPVAASAQTQTPAQPEIANRGAIDFGVRGTRATGDPARYERYRDLGDGLFVQRLQAVRETDGGWILRFTGDNVGRRDQRFVGDFVKSGKFKGWAMWDQIPMLFSRTTRTLFAEDFDDDSPSVVTIDDALQSQVQAAPTSILDVFNRNAREFELRSRRHSAVGGFEYLPTQSFTVRSQVQFTDRDGGIPFGGSFGHSSLVEFPLPVNHTLTDVTGNAEYSRDTVLLRAGYTGSFFSNEATSAVFDNPFRLTDIAGTPSRGALSVAPSNSFVSVNGMGSLRLPHRTRATAYVSLGSLKDAGDPLMAQTVNTANLTAPLERGFVEGEARTMAVNLSFVSRPTRYLDFNVQFRSYDFDNQTPIFNLTQRVAYDGTPSAIAGGVHTEPFGVVRRNFDADFKVTPVRGATAGVGFGRIDEERSHRIFESTTENVLRATFDAIGTGLFSVRTKYEHSQRRGEGIEHGEAELASIGEQPGMRHFDVAPRDRDRVTLVATITPASTWSINGSVAAGRDDYRLELPRTDTPLESLFGLRDNSHRVYSVGMDAIPAERVTLGGSYSFERYNALNRSRQASPGAEFTDPRRNWSAEGTDRVHSFIVSAGVTEIDDKLDLQFSYDYNRSRATYEYFAGTVPNRTLPEETLPDPTLPTPTSLPTVRGDLGRGSVDAIYSLTERIGVGLSYWYENYSVSDFTLDIEANPVLARGQAVLMGYIYRPYTANTFWGRLIVRW